ncbi:hypothetical protein [Endozoicomonas sp. YOMI1]|uniref:hypothetical protein n=1 Tax=Endozoicomonas sp. YOMI1 TaxID=2828739 RepID=UPI00214879BD|nr:hypothetical protein [Endozoicomonas sp. YOMI1]
MQNVNSGVTPTQSTGYVNPSGAGDHSLSPAVAALGDVLPTPGLNSRLCPPEQAISTNGIESITDRNVELVQCPLRDEINGAFRDFGNTDAAGTSSVNPERTFIRAMKNELIKSVRDLLSSNARVCGLATSGNTRGQLQLIVTADYDCSQEERQQLLTDVELFLQSNVPERLRTEFKLNIEYGGPIVPL